MIAHGDVRWFRFRRPDKKRPVVVLTRNSAIAYLGELTVAPITTTIRSIDSEVVLTQHDGMPRDCAVNLDHLMTVKKSEIGSLISRLNNAKLDELRAALLFAFELSP
ncbi:MAG: type II toxin-antitoxin system PemK/MazF family toxin [Candidatus Sumerlaeaceae bacterium]